MGLFSREDKVDLPPSKTKRLECWDARDKFFECLNKNEIDNSLDAKERSKVDQKCGDLDKRFKSKCVQSWYKYFQEKRYNDLLRQRYIEKLEAEGAQPLPIKLGPR